MATADFVGGRIAVSVPRREKYLAEKMPGLRYHAASETWRVGYSWNACVQLRGVFGPSLAVGPALAERARGDADTSRHLRALQHAALDPSRTVPGADPRLYPFQQTAVRFLRTAEAAILADDLGTGKTVQSLSAIAHWPLLVVTTKAVKSQWAAEIPVWCEGARVWVLDGSVAKRAAMLAEFTEAVAAGGRNALVINWGQLPSHSRLAKYGSIALTPKDRENKELNAVAWGTVIADEAHKAKSPKTKQTRALWAVGDSAASRYALTGTPIEQSLLDFWALLRFVDPVGWPTKSGFIDRYCIAEENYFGGVEVRLLHPDTEQEFRDLSDLRFLRRSKALVAPHLPPIVRVQREVELSSAQKKAYRQLEKEFVAELESGGSLVVLSDMAKAGRLAQLTSSMMEELPDGTYRLCEPSPKLDELENLLEDTAGAPVVVFAASRQLLTLLQKRLEAQGTAYGLVCGGQSDEERKRAREDYNSGRTSLLLISLGSGAEGLNLTRGSTMVFLDRAWSSLQNRQAEGRLHGIGRGDREADQITVVDLVVKGTVDEGRLKLYASKDETLQRVVRDAEAVKRFLKGDV